MERRSFIARIGAAALALPLALRGRGSAEAKEKYEHWECEALRHYKKPKHERERDARDSQ